tara:strand:- start:122859 stop:124604 length:1746 start_codon:yes stop_codon:yes gene_type:complete
MYRTFTCGELNIKHIGQEVTLSGWVQKTRDLGSMTFLDIRDRYGITQVVFNNDSDAELCKEARSLGREFVIQLTGTVAERSNKNMKMPTGEIEIIAQKLTILNASETPPFTIEDNTDGGEDIRMKYRYLDLRRNPLKEKLMLRHKVSLETRKYLDAQSFVEVETPYLIKSTPEGARDFVVPSRMNAGEFYALPQSPQTFKQLLMVAGYDKYYQIVKCFRDEDLRADRQPEFTQIDCEMSFVEQEDILNVFEGLTKYIFKTVRGVDLPDFIRMPYSEAMEKYGNDKPDMRFGMLFNNISAEAKGHDFPVFDAAEDILAINVTGGTVYTRKQLDAFTNFVKRPQVGAKGMVYVKYNEDGSIKSSVDKFYSEEVLKTWLEKCDSKPGDTLFILSGDNADVYPQMSALRLHVADEQGLRDKDVFVPMWVTDFPLLEWDADNNRFHAMHHPFTSPKKEDFDLLESDPGKVRANAYDMVINGVEIGGGSIRIFDRDLQSRMFSLLGFSEEEAQSQFGFLMDAFKYGAPPHGGIAFGFDRLCAMMGGTDSIRDYIAFPKNNSGKDVMIDAPSPISEEQLNELTLKLKD